MALSPGSTLGPYEIQAPLGAGRTLAAVLASTLVVVIPAFADDWPQWRGTGRLGVWYETGIVETLPEELQITWRTPIRSGYSGPAVAGGRVFITDWMEDPNSRTLDGTERAIALDEQTGEVLWTHEWQTTYRMLMVTYAVGPRATPTVDEDRVYVVGATGRLFCFDVETGAVLWQKDYIEDLRHERAGVGHRERAARRRRAPDHGDRGRAGRPGRRL